MSTLTPNKLDLRIDGAASHGVGLRTDADTSAAAQNQFDSTGTIEPSAPLATGATIVEGNVAAIADQAAQAAIAIQDLRKQELDIVTDSKNNPYGYNSAARETAAQALQTEISDIAQRTNIVGQPSLGSGQLLTIDENGSNRHEAFALPNAAPLTTTVNNLDAQTQANAAVTESSLKEILDGTASLVSGFRAVAANADAKTTDKPANPLAGSTPVNGRLSFDEAHNLALGIAQKISLGVNNEAQFTKLIDLSTRDLTQERADSLLMVG